MERTQSLVIRSIRFATLALALTLISCGNGKLPQASLTGSVMGTQFNIAIVTGNGKSPGKLPDDIPGIFDSFDNALSTFIADSEISKFNQHDSTEWFPTSIEFCKTLEDALVISRATGGAFDISVGKLVNLWGFGPEGVLLKPPSDGIIEQALQSTGHRMLHTDCEHLVIRKDDPDLYIDLSGYAKGLAVDAVAQALDVYGYSNYLVELGGEIRVRGHNSSREPWRIAIEKPGGGDRSVQSSIRLSAGALATSGDYRNFFLHEGVRYSHTIDLRTGYPVAHELASVTVVSESAAFADAMATALLVMGREKGLSFATRNELAAYFIVRTESGFQTIMTPLFESIIEP